MCLACDHSSGMEPDEFTARDEATTSRNGLRSRGALAAVTLVLVWMLNEVPLRTTSNAASDLGTGATGAEAIAVRAR